MSHQKYHHRYTLYQGSDGEDTPNYVELKPLFVFGLFVYLIQPKALAQCLWRLFSLTPVSRGWRGRGFKLDTWEQFIGKNANEAERRQVRRMSVACLAGHAIFVALSIYAGYWFLPVLVTLAPFYGAGFMGFMAGIHQYAACEANNPDFRISCGSVRLDPLTSFLYWRMEHHIEYHMFAAIPCYNLRRFSRLVADQLPPRKPALPRLIDLNRICKEKYGSYKAWRDGFGKGDTTESFTGEALRKEICRRIRLARSYGDQHRNLACRTERTRAPALRHPHESPESRNPPGPARVAPLSEREVFQRPEDAPRRPPTLKPARGALGER